MEASCIQRLPFAMPSLAVAAAGKRHFTSALSPLMRPLLRPVHALSKGSSRRFDKSA